MDDAVLEAARAGVAGVSTATAIPRPLGASFLAGWSVPPLSVNDLTNRRTELWLVPPGTGAPPRRIAAGSLIPWGQGCALLVEDCQ